MLLGCNCMYQDTHCIPPFSFLCPCAPLLNPFSVAIYFKMIEIIMTYWFLPLLSMYLSGMRTKIFSYIDLWKLSSPLSPVISHPTVSFSGQTELPHLSNYQILCQYLTKYFIKKTQTKNKNKKVSGSVRLEIKPCIASS